MGSGLGLALVGKGRGLLAPCFSAMSSSQLCSGSFFKPLLRSINQVPRLAQSDQELSLVLIIFNWALAAGFWCLPGLLCLKACLRDSINKN